MIIRLTMFGQAVALEIHRGPQPPAEPKPAAEPQPCDRQHRDGPGFTAGTSLHTAIAPRR